MRLQTKVALILLVMVLPVAFPITVSAEGRQIEVIWIQKGPTIYKATILCEGETINITTQCISGAIKIIEINGIPQNSSGASHPWLFEVTRVEGSRYIQCVKGAEALLAQWFAFSQAKITIPYWNASSQYVYVHLEKSDAEQVPKVFWAIYDLFEVCADQLQRKGYVDQSRGVCNAKNPLWNLKDSEYLKVYRQDANPDGSIDFIVPLTYPTQVCTRYHWWSINDWTGGNGYAICVCPR